MILQRQDPFFRNRRRNAVSQHGTQVGIDYVELDSMDDPLKLYFIPAASGVTGKTVRPTISTDNIRIQSENGFEQSDIRARAVNAPADPDNVLEIVLAYDEQMDIGDFTAYTLQLINIQNIDPFFAQVNFSLQVNEPSPLDPQAASVEDSQPQSTPEIDYLAKDYSSFRQLIFNRLSLLMSEWKERNPADLGNALVELLAYAGDYVSYYQDAVATEAYLSTARLRLSVRRHARLLDSPMHEGCNARVGVQVQVNQNITLPAGSKLLTKVAGQAAAVVDLPTYQQAVIQGATVFETMEEKDLFEEQNNIDFYTWGAGEFVLPEGSTSATLYGNLSSLKAGQILIFEEVVGPTTGKAADADPQHRVAVRLSAVTVSEDPIGSQLYNTSGPTEITEITWHDEDALPFPLTVSTNDLADQGNITVARGNIVLADHGRTIENEKLIPATVPAFGRYEPYLRHTNLTYSIPYDQLLAQRQSVTSLFKKEPREAMPAITLTQNGSETWLLLPDLLNCDAFTQAFVVEMENDRRARLRFGNGVQGKQPVAGDYFEATYRVGNGPQGNVGHQTIAHLLTQDASLTANVSQVCNLLPAQGGVEPEPISEFCLHAPTAFQTQERCVTEKDYVTIAKRHPEVEHAAANLRWTGSWYTAMVVVKRVDDKPVDAEFEETLREFMEPYRLIGYEIKIRPPHFVSLDIAFTIHVAKDYFANTVKRTLLQTFSAVDLPNAQRGFFHPNHFTFGQSVYLSQMITKAVSVPGVLLVSPTRFRRWGRPSQNQLETGEIRISPLEIARLQNDPDAPQRGRIEFNMEGGR